jgi:hypothetical protein
MEPHPSSKTQSSQTYKNHLVVRTPLYIHTTLIVHEFSPNKSQRRNCTAALQQHEVWPPSTGLPSFGIAPAGSRGRGSLRLTSRFGISIPHDWFEFFNVPRAIYRA